MKKICILFIITFGLSGCAELRQMNFNDIVNETREIKVPIKVYGQKPKVKIKSKNISFRLTYNF